MNIPKMTKYSQKQVRKLYGETGLYDESVICQLFKNQ